MNHRNNPESMHPIEIQTSLHGFREDYPDPTKVAFVMMKFGGTNVYDRIIDTIRLSLDRARREYENVVLKDEAGSINVRASELVEKQVTAYGLRDLFDKWEKQNA